MFSFIKNIILKGKHIIHPLKQVSICYYNPRCLVSIGLMFDDIILNLSRNKEVNQHMEVIDSYFTKTENNNVFMYRDSLQDFSWKKSTHEDRDAVCPHIGLAMMESIELSQ